MDTPDLLAYVRANPGRLTLLSQPREQALAYLADHPDTPSNALGHALGLSRRQTRLAVADLDACGYINPPHRDGRVSLLTISDLGREYLTITGAAS